MADRRKKEKHAGEGLFDTPPEVALRETDMTTDHEKPRPADRLGAGAGPKRGARQKAQSQQTASDLPLPKAAKRTKAKGRVPDDHRRSVLAPAANEGRVERRSVVRSGAKPSAAKGSAAAKGTARKRRG